MTSLQVDLRSVTAETPALVSPVQNDFAIVFIDIVGYSALLGEDDVGTVFSLEFLRDDLILPLVREYDGRLAGTAGDAFLLAFANAVDAGRFAFALQAQMAERKNVWRVPIQLRIGIDFGAAIVREAELYGSTLNVAARLQTLAPPGGVCVSAAVHDLLAPQLGQSFQPLGLIRLKGIDRPLEAFLSKPDSWGARQNRTGYGGLLVPGSSEAMPPASRGVQQRQSLAVMRFANIGGTLEDGYIAEGVVEDVITAVSRFRSLFVIGPSTSMRYVSGTDDPMRVGRELGVRYVVEGKFRRIGADVRTSARLVDAETGAQLWAERFDLSEADLFERQDRITHRIVMAIEPSVLASEIERATRKPTEHLDAYDFYLRAMTYRGSRLRGALVEHHRLLANAMRLDPSYAPALAFAALCYAINVDHVHGIPWLDDRSAGLSLAQASLAAGPDDPVALVLAAHAQASLTEEFRPFLGQIDRAMSLNPNYAEGWIRSGVFRVAIDELTDALAHTEQAIRLSPQDRYIWLAHVVRGNVLLLLGRYAEAEDAARVSLNQPVRHPWAYRTLIAALQQSGRHADAKVVASEFLCQSPDFRISLWRSCNSFTRHERYDIVEKSLRAVGIPE